MALHLGRRDFNILGLFHVFSRVGRQWNDTMITGERIERGVNGNGRGIDVLFQHFPEELRKMVKSL
jgi:hypothetical protein